MTDAVKRKRYAWAVLWINARNQRRVRWFDDFNAAINFRAKFPLDRSAMFKCKNRIGL